MTENNFHSGDSLGNGGLRIHVSQGVPIHKGGGTNSAVLGIVQGQHQLHLTTQIVHNIGYKYGEISSSQSVPPFARQLTRHSPIQTLTREDAIHYHFAHSKFLLRDVGLDTKNAKRVFHFHGPWALESRVQGDSGLKVALKRAFERFMYNREDTIICASDSFRNILISEYQVQSKKIHVAGLGVDTSRFSIGDSRESRSTLNIPLSNRLLLGTVRRLVPRMGIEYLIRALPLISDADLMIAGQGPLEKSLRDLAHDLKVSERVRFLGRISDEELVHFYRAIDLMVVPTVELEGFGLVVLEALACGTPVLATNVGALVSTLGPFGVTHVVPPRSDLAIAEWVNVNSASILSSNSDDYRKYALNCSWKSVAANIESIISV